MAISRDHKNVAVLATCQSLFATGQAMLIILSGLVGAAIAENKALATLPVSTVVIAAMLTTVPASLLMKRIGRRAGFMIGAFIGACGATLSVYAIYLSNFWLFSFATLIIGMYSGFAQYYRFAAADVAEEHFKSRAISWVISGGIIAAFAGPELARRTYDMFADTLFLGSYVVVAVLAVTAIGFLAMLDIPLPDTAERHQTGRPLAVIVEQSSLIVAIMVAMIGYGVMSLLMTATPLAMTGYGFKIGDVTFVIQWHVLAMFAPAFVTGALIHRFGAVWVMLSGTVLLAFAVAAALAGVGISNYLLALAALGMGWNFTFVAASSLLTETYEPAERAKVQALNDFTVFGTVALASLTSGAVLHFLDWRAVNIAAIAPIAIAMTGSLWLAVKRRVGGKH